MDGSPDQGDSLWAMSDGAKALSELRAKVVARLRERQPEIVQAIHTRILEAVPDSTDGRDPTYRAGLLAAVSAVLDYGLDAIEHGSTRPGSVPPEAAVQARRAARAGVEPGAVIRRYVAGHGRLGEFVAEEAERAGLAGDGTVLHNLRRTQEALLERLIAAIEREHVEEREQMTRLPDNRRTEIVQRLLAEEPVEPPELAGLGYELHESWHLGVIATGGGVQDTFRHVKTHLGCEVLLALVDDDTIWAWLGASRKLKIADVERLLSVGGDTDLSLAVGGLRRGLDGWRQTHHEAGGARLRAQRRPERVVRYADGPLLAAALGNDTLAMWLKELLSPLCGRPDSERLLRTLRAYIDAECNKSSAASSLQIQGHTVADRLRKAEKLLGRPLGTCLAELYVAVHLAELTEDSETSTGSTKLVGPTNKIGRSHARLDLIVHGA
jgi:PucR C-terminal helix-turn-helix domain